MQPKILVVDDSPVTRTMLHALLTPANVHVIEAEDGWVAERQIARNPDLAMILVDLHMPRKDGLELLQDLHERGDASHVPIVVLTHDAQPAAMRRAREAGAKGWLLKPCTCSTLLDAVTRFVPLDTRHLHTGAAIGE